MTARPDRPAAGGSPAGPGSPADTADTDAADADMADADTADTALPSREDGIRDAILAAALPHMAFDGWSRATLGRGAVDAGHDALTVARVFPGGAADAVAWHSRRADARMTGALDRMDLAAMRVRDRIATAVRLRLDQNRRDRAAIGKALVFLARPGQTALAARCLYHTVDDIWHAAGDRATDFNFYSKRGLLAGVYASTLVFWLSDTSDDDAETRAFLDRRLTGVMSLPRMAAPVGRLARAMPDPVRFLRAFRERRRSRYAPAG